MTMIQRLRLGDRVVIGPDVVLIVTRADSDNRLTLAIDAPAAWTIERTRRDGSVLETEPAEPPPDRVRNNRSELFSTAARQP